jgi:hypothetical protein
MDRYFAEGTDVILVLSNHAYDFAYDVPNHTDSARPTRIMTALPVGRPGDRG